MINPEATPFKNYIFIESTLLSWQLFHVWSPVNASCVLLLSDNSGMLLTSWDSEKKSSSSSGRCQATVCFSLLENTAPAQLQLLPKQPELASVSPQYSKSPFTCCLCPLPLLLSSVGIHSLSLVLSPWASEWITLHYIILYYICRICKPYSICLKVFQTKNEVQYL